jgi:hypothetical protein
MRYLVFIPKILILALLFAAYPTPAPAQFALSVSVDVGPPALPVYVQPAAPAPNMIWEPGYWGWGSAGYYWVPGVWLYAPQTGYLWTPGYWYANSGYYAWHPGYWATQVGYYGGINYGFGYFGLGYVGGGWYGNVFRYNTAVTNVDTTVIRNVYVDRTVIVNNNVNVNTRVSYNGGPGGVMTRPTSAELAVQNGYHIPATSVQVQHQHVASQDRTALATVNNGRPATTAVTAPLSNANRPDNFQPVQAQDRAMTQTHTVPAYSRPANTYQTQRAQPYATQHAQPYGYQRTARPSATERPEPARQ